MTSLPRPIPRQSEKARKRAVQLRHTKAVVSRRARGRCEGCGVVGPVDLSHVFGRGVLIAAEYADSPECTQALCRLCHRAVDGYTDVEMRNNLRWAAAERFALVHGLPFQREGDPVDWIRGAERQLRERETS